MSSTRLGKVLVFANLFVGVGLFAWALSLYANRLDYFDRKDADPPVEGRFTALKKQIDELSATVRAAQGAYARAAFDVRDYEQVRDVRSAVFDRRINLVRRGNDPAVLFRQQVLVRDPRFPGLIDVGQEGPVVKGVRNNDLQGLGYLQAQFEQAVRDEATLKGRIAEARKQLGTLSDSTEKVQAEVFKQRVIRDNLRGQRDYLADLQVNWDERLRVLERRKTQLQVRLEQLGVNQKSSKAGN